MLKTMLTKVRSKKGFTLMEMLIVVAIIAILIAVAVPTFTASLNKAKEAVDDANYRSALALSSSAYLLGQADPNQLLKDTHYYQPDGSFKDGARADAYKSQTTGSNGRTETGMVIQATADGKVKWIK